MYFTDNLMNSIYHKQYTYSIHLITKTDFDKFWSLASARIYQHNERLSGSEQDLKSHKSGEGLSVTRKKVIFSLVGNDKF